MAEDGIVGEYNGAQAREVLISGAQWEAMKNGGEVPDEVASVPKSKSPRRGTVERASEGWDEDEVEEEESDVEIEEEEYDDDYEGEEDEDEFEEEEAWDESVDA